MEKRLYDSTAWEGRQDKGKYQRREREGDVPERTF